MIVIGIVRLQAFVVWTRRRTEAGRTPLLALEVVSSPSERAAVYAMFAVVALEGALNFSVPLYIQIIQGRTPIETAIAMMPFNLTVFFTAMLIIKLYDKLAPQQIGRWGFVLCTIALLWLAWVVRNEWSAPVVMIELIVFGIGQGSLVTLLFNVLVTASPKELAGDVGSLRGTTNNLAAAVGTAFSGALLVGLLSAFILASLGQHPELKAELQSQVDLDNNITFVSNERLLTALERTNVSPEHIREAVRINEEGRLRALKIGLLVMAALSLLAIFPASRLPNYRPGEIPANLIEVARLIAEGFASGFDGAVVVQGTDTIEESAFLLDLLVDSDKPVVVTGAMRGADAPGAEGPANLLSAAIVAASPQSRGLGTLVVLNYDIHAARFVQKSHTALPSAFLSPLVGPIGTLIERQPRFHAQVKRNPTLSTAEGSPAPVALVKVAMGDDGRLLGSLPGLGYPGVVLEGMGAGHVPAEVAPLVGDLAVKIPVVLASRAMTGHVFTQTYGYPGAEIDLIKRGVVPSGYLSGLKARLLLGLVLRSARGAASIPEAFAPYR
ncbi:MAG TPA: hypothetical protein DIT03_11605 [Candidatus Accumulibacter sp.]|nr:hypothetical protein [Accumulibacter sp.]HCN68882.1 hypothetical protein [Accumulibacter sp.]